MKYKATRFAENPIIRPDMDGRIGTNINGPSLIRVPDWVASPLGRYYLYFAHHQGEFIRLAFADFLHGPWKIHAPGALRLDETSSVDHVASPDVHVDHERREIVMYFHGCMAGAEKHFAGQRSYHAVSRDGLHFKADDTVLGPFYFRVFKHAGWHYAVAKRADAELGGVLLRSRDGRTAFEQGQNILPRQRHAGLLKHGDILRIFFSQGGDCPERILAADMPLAGDWRTWTPGEPADVLVPEEDYEGRLLPLVPSWPGAIHEPVRQLRDPAIFEEDGKTYLIYSAAGESSLCMAELLPGD